MHQQSTRFYFTLLLGVFFLSGAGTYKASATHFGAVDLFVDFIGSDSTNLKYRVTLQLYGGCEGIPQSTNGTSEYVSWASASAGYNSGRSIQQVNLHTVSYHNPVAIPPLGHAANDTLDQLCGNPKPLSLCYTPYNPTGPNYHAYVLSTYIDTVTLPARAADWKFWWTSGARKNAIVNLANPGGVNIYCEAGLNNLEPGRWNNSTPRYTYAPLQYQCVHQLSQFINNPAELPADAALDTMHTINFQPINVGLPSNPNYYFCHYAQGYSLTNPIKSATNYTVHPITGTAYFYPTVQGRFVLAFRTYEHARTGQSGQPPTLMGYVSRDVLVYVLPCAGTGALPVIHLPPTQLTGGTQLADSIVAVPVHQQVTMEFKATAGVAGNAIRFGAFNGYAAPGSHFTVNYLSPDTATAHFTWIPPDTGTYIIPLYAIDSSCVGGLQIPKYSYRNLYLQVVYPMSVRSATNQEGLSVWPNPAGKVIFLKGKGIVRAEVLSTDGRLVAAYDRPSGSLDISRLIPGMYLLRLRSGIGSVYVRFIKE